MLWTRAVLRRMALAKARERGYCLGVPGNGERRMWTNHRTILLAAASMMVFGCVAAGPEARPPFPRSARERMEELLRDIERACPIEVVHDEVPPGKGSPVGVPELLHAFQFLEVLKEELLKYPPGFLHNAGVRKVYLVRGSPDHCYYHGATRSFTIGCGVRHDPVWQRHCIHHEIWHAVDMLGAPLQVKRFMKWHELNEPGVKYVGESGFDRSRAGSLNHPQKGFVSSYAMVDPLEDRAEVFAAIMVVQERMMLDRWMCSDEVLKRKVAEIHAYVTELDEHFWEWAVPGDAPPLAKAYRK